MTEQERQAKANQRAHRRAEAAALLLLRTAAEKERSRYLPAAAAELRAAALSAVVLGRSNARKLGIERLEAEAEALNLPVAAPAFPMDRLLQEDFARARRAADSYASAWYAEASATDAATATKALAHRVERIAATESSGAFSAGRTAVLRRSGGRYARVWDATLDRRTCETCYAAHGEVAPPGQAFSAGEPGEVHPFCRCTYYLIRLS